MCTYSEGMASMASWTGAPRDISYALCSTFLQSDTFISEGHLHGRAAGDGQGDGCFMLAERPGSMGVGAIHVAWLRTAAQLQAALPLVLFAVWTCTCLPSCAYSSWKGGTRPSSSIMPPARPMRFALSAAAGSVSSIISFMALRSITGAAFSTSWFTAVLRRGAPMCAQLLDLLPFPFPFPLLPPRPPLASTATCLHLSGLAVAPASWGAQPKATARLLIPCPKLQGVGKLCRLPSSMVQRVPW